MAIGVQLKTLRELNEQIDGTFIIDGMDTHFVKIGTRWVHVEKDVDLTLSPDKTDRIIFPVNIEVHLTPEQRIEDLETTQNAFRKEIDQLKSRLDKLENPRPKLDFNKTPNDKPWQIFNDDNSDLLKQGIQVLNFITKNVSTK